MELNHLSINVAEMQAQMAAATTWRITQSLVVKAAEAVVKNPSKSNLHELALMVRVNKAARLEMEKQIASPRTNR